MWIFKNMHLVRFLKMFQEQTDTSFNSIKINKIKEPLVLVISKTIKTMQFSTEDWLFYGLLLNYFHTFEET
jgi:pimeloyl-CoA synthetase